MVAETTGGVAPLGWLQSAEGLIDEALNDYKIIWAASGHPHAVFPAIIGTLKSLTDAQPMIVGD